MAVVNYDTNNLHLAPYDWRLSYSNLEVRDSYFSKLKATIEGFVYVLRFCETYPSYMYTSKRENERVVLVPHSMGSSVRMSHFTIRHGSLTA